MPKAMITGAAGFIGLQVSKRLLAEGYQLQLVDNLQRGRWDSEFCEIVDFPQVTFKKLDICDPEAFDELDTDCNLVFHFAAMLGVDRVLKAPFDVLTTNAAGMQNILKWARSLGRLERFVFSSTSEIYAGTRSHFSVPVPTPETVAITLEGVEKARTSYALSKAYGEALLHAADIPFTILRYHNVYGPRMGFDHVIPQIISKILRDSNVPVPSADHTRAFCYIDDAVKQTVAAATATRTQGQTLNSGNSREEIKIIDLVQKIANVLKVEINIQPEPATMGSPDRRCPDTRKITELTGLSASIDLDQGLQRTCEWYLPHYAKETAA
jgi:nucleoside-diphosphate-sugar epimerase